MPAGKEENNIESKYEPGQMSQPAPSQPAASVKVAKNIDKFKVIISKPFPLLHAASLQSEG